FPDRKLLLFGEYEDLPSALERHDIALLPGWEVTRLPPRADIFINKNSLGEMAEPLSRLFIEECTRRADAFWHLNHESFRYDFGGDVHSMLNGEYPVPADYRLVYRNLDSISAIFASGSVPENYEYL